MRKITPEGDVSVQLSVGETVALLLEELPGAGFLWKLDDNLGACARLESSTFEDAEEGDGIGGSSKRVVKIIATKPGTCEISGRRGQQWEPAEQSDKSFTLHIAVE